MRCAEEVLQASRQGSGIEAKCDERAPFRASTLDLTENVLGIDGIRGHNNDEDARRVNCLNDGVRVEHAGGDVARCDPAYDAPSFECGANGIGRLLVRRSVTYEDVCAAAVAMPRRWRCRRVTSGFFLAVPFSHVDPPPTFTSCWQMHPGLIKVYRAFTEMRANVAFGACRLILRRSVVGRSATESRPGSCLSARRIRDRRHPANLDPMQSFVSVWARIAEWPRNTIQLSYRSPMCEI